MRYEENIFHIARGCRAITSFWLAQNGVHVGTVRMTLKKLYRIRRSVNRMFLVITPPYLIWGVGQNPVFAKGTTVSIKLLDKCY